MKNVIIDNEELAAEVKNIDFRKIPSYSTTISTLYITMAFNLLEKIASEKIDLNNLKIKILKTAIAIEADSILEKMINYDKEIPTQLDLTLSINDQIHQLMEIIYSNSKIRVWFITTARKEAFNYCDK